MLALVLLPASANSCLSRPKSLSLLLKGRNYLLAPTFGGLTPPPSSGKLTSSKAGGPPPSTPLRRPAVEPFFAVAHGRRVAGPLAISFSKQWLLSPTRLFCWSRVRQQKRAIFLHADRILHCVCLLSSRDNGSTLSARHSLHAAGFKGLPRLLDS